MFCKKVGHFDSPKYKTYHILVPCPFICSFDAFSVLIYNVNRHENERKNIKCKGVSKQLTRIVCMTHLWKMCTHRRMNRIRHLDEKVLLIAKSSFLSFMSAMQGDKWSSSTASNWGVCMFRWNIGAEQQGRGTWGWGGNKAIEINEMLQNKNINNNQGQTCRCMRTRWILASALASASGAGWQCDSPGTGWPGFSCHCCINTAAPVNIDKCAQQGRTLPLQLRRASN